MGLKNKFTFYCLMILSMGIENIFGNGADTFITKINEIHVPGVMGAYNASLIEDGDGYLMAYRYDTYSQPFSMYHHYQNISLMQLDSNFHTIGDSFLCKEVGNRAYDPRLARIDDKIFLIYASARPGETTSHFSSQLCLTQIHKEDDVIQLALPIALKVSFQNNWEKNWVLFNYRNALAISYTINPHVVVMPSLEDGSCTHFSTSAPKINWDYGIIRGGTPAILVDGEYLAFFHSSQPNSWGWHTYYMGAYTFSAEPPFQVTRISSKPFAHPDFYTAPKTALSHSHVLFPGGVVFKNDRIFVCYGENDAAIKVMEIDKALLYESLIEVSQ